MTTAFRFRFLTSILFAIVLAACSERAAVLAPRFAFCSPANCGSDQGQLVVDIAANPLALGGASEQILAQVVTADTSGRVVQVALPVACEGTDLLISVRDVNPDGSPTAPSVAPTFSRRIPNALVRAPLDGTLHVVDLGRGFNVTMGQQFAIVLAVADSTGSCGVQQGPLGDSYAFGDGWFIALPNPTDVWVSLSTSAGRNDLPFETFVRLR